MATPNLGACPKCFTANPYDKTVCNECGARLPWADALDSDRRKTLADEQAKRLADLQARAAAARAARHSTIAKPPAKKPNAGGMICEHCGYMGQPKRFSQVNGAVCLMLFCIGILPALIYAIWAGGKDYQGCPKCEARNMIPTNTPRGQMLVQQFYPHLPTT